MLIREFRIPMPLTLNEYRIGQLYGVAQLSLENSGTNEGIEILKNETFTNTPLLNGKFHQGQYTHKVYHLASRIPGFVRLVLPKHSMEVHEEAWNAFPYCKTVLTNPGVGSKFCITIESYHTNGLTNEENALCLPEDLLEHRKIVHIDIANDYVDPKEYKPEEDPKLFRSAKFNRGPLLENWMETCKPIMTCYKLVQVTFHWFGLQHRAEEWVQKSEQRLFLNFHRHMFCTIDKWGSLTLKDIRKLEDEIANEINRLRTIQHTQHPHDT